MRELGILVVQQDADVAARIGGELEGGSFRVAGPVPDLKRALARAEGQVFDAVLLDLYLADSGGLATLRRFRGGHPDLPVVLTVSRPHEAEARRALAEGAAQYLLHDELGRGLAAAVLRHAADRADEVRAGASPARRLVHDLGNLLAVANGECEMLLDRLAGDDPMAEDLRRIHDAIGGSIRLFRQFVAARRVEADAGRPA